MTSRQTIGENPLDAVIPHTKAPTKTSKRRLAPAGTTLKPEKRGPAQKERVTFHVSTELVEHLRDAVYWTPGATLAGIAEDALAKGVMAMEKKRGESFPKRKGAIKTGRPVKSL